MAKKIGKDYIINEDELKLMFQSAFVFGYCAERNQDYGKLGWDYACTTERNLTEKIREQEFIDARARWASRERQK